MPSDRALQTGWTCSISSSSPAASMRRSRLASSPRSTELVLKATSQAAERCRAGMLCFCLFRPTLLPERAASVISYDTGAARRSTTRTIDTLEMGNVIGAIGLPAIVEAEIPLAWCGDDRSLRLAMIIGQRFVVAQGTRSPDAVEVEDRIKRPLPPELIRAVHVFPSPKFVTLSGCSSWDRPSSRWTTSPIQLALSRRVS